MVAREIEIFNGKFDIYTFKLKRGTKTSLPLTKNEFRVLSYFDQNPDASNAEMNQDLFGEGTRSGEVHLARLRDKIKGLEIYL